MFPRALLGSPGFKPFMEAAGIEPAQDSPGPHAGWVYLIYDGGWSYKIGWARNPAKRLAGLQTAHAEELRLVAVIEGPPALERDLHDLFGLYRIRGEWFIANHEIRGYFADHGFPCICPRGGVDQECFLHSEETPAW